MIRCSPPASRNRKEVWQHLGGIDRLHAVTNHRTPDASCPVRPRQPPPVSGPPRSDNAASYPGAPAYRLGPYSPSLPSSPPLPARSHQYGRSFQASPRFERPASRHARSRIAALHQRASQKSGQAENQRMPHVAVVPPEGCPGHCRGKRSEFRHLLGGARSDTRSGGTPVTWV